MTKAEILEVLKNNTRTITKQIDDNPLKHLFDLAQEKGGIDYRSGFQDGEKRGVELAIQVVANNLTEPSVTSERIAEIILAECEEEGITPIRAGGYDLPKRLANRIGETPNSGVRVEECVYIEQGKDSHEYQCTKCKEFTDDMAHYNFCRICGCKVIW